MHGPSLVALVAAAVAGFAAALLLIMTSDGQQQTASSVIVHIPDNPPSQAATEFQKSEIIAALPTPAEEFPEEEVVPEPPSPERLFITDVIRRKLSDPALRRGAQADDLAAVEAFYEAHDGPALWMTTAGISAEGKAILEEMARADQWGLDPGAFSVPPPTNQPEITQEQAAAEIALSLAVLKYARHARGGRVAPSSLSKLIDQSPPLRDPKAVLTEIAAAEMPDAYLRSLHPKHSQFALLRDALLKEWAKDQASLKDVNKILINMERWRWMPEHLGSLHVWLNTPEFMMHVVKGGKVIHSEKTVVGERRYATPIFSANMKTIVFNPKWTVPPTIVREDLLPKLRRGGGGGWFGGGSNTAVLKKHQLKVLYKGREVDPGRIDWNNVNMSAISFRQDPGPTNVLGKVKFVYPNKHIVYMHDTIKRDLLKKEVRVEGHHCPRVDNPGQVAAVLLAEDKGWDKSKIDQLLAKGHDSAVGLGNPIPVHTTYFTVVVDADGKVRTFADIYGLDDRVTKVVAIKERSSQAPTASAPETGDAGNLVDSTP